MLEFVKSAPDAAARQPIVAARNSSHAAERHLKQRITLVPMNFQTPTDFRTFAAQTERQTQTRSAYCTLATQPRAQRAALFGLPVPITGDGVNIFMKAILSKSPGIAIVVTQH